MRRRKLPLFLCVILILFLSISPIYAEDDEDINLLNLDNQLATHWGISAFAAGLFLTTLLSFAFLMPFIVFKKGGIMILIVGIGVMGFCIAIGWLSEWVLLLVALLIAGLYSTVIKKMM